MNDFQLRRFGLVLRRDLIENRKRHLQCLAMFYIGGLLLLCANLYTASRFGIDNTPPVYHADRLLRTTGIFCLMFYGLSLYFGMSDTFRCLRTKQERISYLMLPASPLEKYLSRLVIVTVLWTVGFAAALVLADLTRMLLFAPLQHHIGFSLTAIPGIVFETLTCGNGSIMHSPRLEDYYMFLFLGLGGASWHYSFYLLGSSIFRKRPVVLTTLMLLVGLCLLAYVVSLLPEPDCDISEAGARTIIILIATALYLLAVLNAWLAYRNFRRCPVIGGKWFHF